MRASSNDSPVSPTVSRIVSVLEDRIRSGVYREGEWLPTERDLAVDFQVSRILIRSAIKELERRDFITCFEHRRPLIRGRHTVPETLNASTRSLALWIWPDASWPPAGKTIQGVHEALGDGFRLVLGCPVGSTWEEAKASEARFLRQVLRDNDIEGLLLEYIGGDVNLTQVQALRAANFPVVFLDHLPPPGFEADYVGVNNRQGAEVAVKHLLSLGHRSIAHISNYDVMSTVSERLAGYRRALASARIEYRPELVRQDPGPSGSDPEEGCEELVAHLLALPDPPTALFTVNDIVALRVIAALRSCGRRVPEDMSVVGFDGIERWIPKNPFLTTVEQPFDRMGSQAVELLLDRINDGPSAPFKHMILDVNLAVHKSTRPLPNK